MAMLKNVVNEVADFKSMYQSKNLADNVKETFLFLSFFVVGELFSRCLPLLE